MADNADVKMCTKDSPVELPQWLTQRKLMSDCKDEPPIVKDMCDTLQAYVEAEKLTFKDLIDLVKILTLQLPTAIGYQLMLQGVQITGSNLSEEERTIYGRDSGVRSITINTDGSKLSDKEIQDTVKNMADSKEDTNINKNPFVKYRGNGGNA